MGEVISQYWNTRRVPRKRYLSQGNKGHTVKITFSVTVVFWITLSAYREVVSGKIENPINFRIKDFMRKFFVS